MQTFTDTSPYSVEIFSIVLPRMVRSIATRRMPMVVVSRKITPSSPWRSASSHMTVRSHPGLPFFMKTGE